MYFLYGFSLTRKKITVYKGKQSWTTIKIFFTFSKCRALPNHCYLNFCQVLLQRRCPLKRPLELCIFCCRLLRNDIGGGAVCKVKMLMTHVVDLTKIVSYLLISKRLKEKRLQLAVSLIIVLTPLGSRGGPNRRGLRLRFPVVLLW